MHFRNVIRYQFSKRSYIYVAHASADGIAIRGYYYYYYRCTPLRTVVLLLLRECYPRWGGWNYFLKEHSTI